MKTFINEGDPLEVVAPADVASGAGVLVGSIFGVAIAAAVSGAKVNIKRRGLWTAPKAGATTATDGARAYWDNALSQVTPTASTNKLIGCFVGAATNGPTTCTVLLTGAHTL